MAIVFVTSILNNGLGLLHLSVPDNRVDARQL